MRLTLLIIAMVLAGLFYLGITSLAPTNNRYSLTTPSQALEFDAYAEGISTTLYEKNGNINYTLEADRQVHYTDDVTELDAPFITLFEDGNPHWTIKADLGRIYNNADSEPDQKQVDNIEFKGNVEVSSTSKLEYSTLLLTELLFVDPNLETLQTDQQVRWISQGSDFTGLGMFADLSKEEISLLAQIRGSYENRN